ncbi:MAG: hypothetical protein HY459_02245 [Parcubacteria group bacterium]|nr:hypothetical protein [Parcubacteria group bacterium]
MQFPTGRERTSFILLIAAFFLLAVMLIIVSGKGRELLTAISGTQAVVSCSSDVTCDDGYALTTDSCVNPGLETSYCAHTANRGLSYSSGFSYSNLSEWNESQLIDFSNIIEGPINFADIAQSDFFQSLKNQGKIMARAVSVEEYYGRTNDDIAANKTQIIQAIYDKLTRIYQDGYDAFAFDELIGFEQNDGFRELMSAASLAIEQVKKDYPTKLIFVWGSRFIPTSAIGIETMKRIFTYADFYLPEAYYADEPYTDTELNGFIHDVSQRFENFHPGVGRKILFGLAASDVEDWVTDQNADQDFRKFADNEVYLIKQDATQNLNTGVGVFFFGKVNLETKTWFAKLFKHYLFDNQTSRFSERNYALSYLKNPSFENGTADWAVSVGAGGEVKTITKASITPVLEIVSPWQKVPSKNNVLFLKRGTTANTVTQTTANLVAGKEYMLEVYSKKHSDDFTRSNLITSLTDSAGNTISAAYERHTLFTNLRVFSYDYTLAQCQALKPNCSYDKHYWTRETFVFTAPANQVQVVTTDASAGSGEITLVDFVQLQEYVRALVITPTPTPTPTSPTPTPTSSPTPTPTTTLIAKGDTWKYLDNGTDQRTAWWGVTFNDAGWKSGPAQLGYGDGDEQTVVSFGPNSKRKYITTYFRRTFAVLDPASFSKLALSLLRDDGAVVYLNGVEVMRSNMPTGTITYTTLAASTIDGSKETLFHSAELNLGLLVSGANVVAVEIHQRQKTSSDISFDLELVAF